MLIPIPLLEQIDVLRAYLRTLERYAPTAIERHATLNGTIGSTGRRRSSNSSAIEGAAAPGSFLPLQKSVCDSFAKLAHFRLPIGGLAIKLLCRPL
jgi:hypothetical protein